MLSLPFSYMSNSSLKNNLVYYWNLDGNSTTSFGNNNGTDTAISYTGTGILSSGATFNGSTSQISLVTRPVTSENADYSISIWVNWNVLKSAFSFNTNFNGTICIGIGQLTSVGNIIFQTITNSGQFNNLDSGIFPATGRWYHIVATYLHNATATLRVMKIYVDGVLCGTTSPIAGTTQGGSNTFVFGKTGAVFFNGKIDEVGTWSKVLNASEVLELYNTGIGRKHPF